MRTKLNTELKALPESPGVYIMKDGIGTIIYIGKAVNLKRRVKSYFQGGVKDNRKLERLVTEVAGLEYILADTELEALILECNLIKKHKPHFNSALKNDWKYPFIKITNEAYPCLTLSLNTESHPAKQHEQNTSVWNNSVIPSTDKDSARYYGPFKGTDNISQVIELLRRIWGIRSCDGPLTGKQNKLPCMNYHLKKCAAPCMGSQAHDEYLRGVGKAEKFLRGKHGETLRRIKSEMDQASKSLLFELAAQRRDELKVLRLFAYKHKLSLDSLKDRDLLIFTEGLQVNYRDAVIIYLIRFGKLLAKTRLTSEILEGTTDSTEAETHIEEFLLANLPDRDFCRRAYSREEIDEIMIIQGWLKHGKAKKALLEIKASERGRPGMNAANAVKAIKELRLVSNHKQ